jgi:hypothetical protein
MFQKRFKGKGRSFVPGSQLLDPVPSQELVSKLGQLALNSTIYPHV